MFAAAFFKGHSAGLAGLFDILDHAWMQGDYSHVELVFSDGRSGSADITSGVRFTTPGSINFEDQTQWDLVPLNPKVFDEGQALLWFARHDGAKYDLWGDVRFVDGFIHKTIHDFFCSESLMDALGFKEGWRFDPNAANYVVKRFANV
jgi:hypothetical protein